MRNDIYVKNLCKNICFLWRKHGLPREEMAALLEADEGMLMQIENGQLPPELTFDALVRFSRRCDVELDKLFLAVE